MIKLPVDSYLAKQKIINVSDEIIKKYLGDTNYKTTTLNELYCDTYYSTFLEIAQNLEDTEIDYDYFIGCMSVAYYLIGNTESIRWMLKGLMIDSTIHYYKTDFGYELRIVIEQLSTVYLSKIFEAIKKCVPYLIYDQSGNEIHILVEQVNIKVTFQETPKLQYYSVYRRIVDA